MAKKSGASENELSELHKKLAQSFSKQLDQSDRASVLLSEYGDELPEAVVSFLEDVSTVSPALLTAVAKFLKDNEITCVVEETEEMSELASILQNKRRARVGNVIPFDE